MTVITDLSHYTISKIGIKQGDSKAVIILKLLYTTPLLLLFILLDYPLMMVLALLSVFTSIPSLFREHVEEE